MGPVYDVVWGDDIGGDGGTAVLVSGSSDATVRVWDGRSGAALHVFRDHETIVNKVWRRG